MLPTADIVHGVPIVTSTLSGGSNRRISSWRVAPNVAARQSGTPPEAPRAGRLVLAMREARHVDTMARWRCVHVPAGPDSTRNGWGITARREPPSRPGQRIGRRGRGVDLHHGVPGLGRRRRAVGVGPGRAQHVHVLGRRQRLVVRALGVGRRRVAVPGRVPTVRRRRRPGLDEDVAVGTAVGDRRRPRAAGRHRPQRGVDGDHRRLLGRAVGRRRCRTPAPSTPPTPRAAWRRSGRAPR